MIFKSLQIKFSVARLFNCQVNFMKIFLVSDQFLIKTKLLIFPVKTERQINDEIKPNKGYSNLHRNSTTSRKEQSQRIFLNCFSCQHLSLLTDWSSIQISFISCFWTQIVWLNEKKHIVINFLFCLNQHILGVMFFFLCKHCGKASFNETGHAFRI